MSNTVITQTEAAGFIPEIWLAMALERLKSYITLQKMVTKDSDLGGGSFTKGATLHIPRRGAITANAKVEGDNYTYQNPTADTVDVTLNQHFEVTITGESRALSVANQDYLAGYIDDAAIALAEQIDASIFAAAIAGQTNTPLSGANLTEALVLSATKTLKDQKVSGLAPKYGVVSTTQGNALRVIDRFSRYDAVGIAGGIAQGTIGAGFYGSDGAFGRIAGVEFSETQLVPVTGSPTEANNLIFTRDALVLASRALVAPPAGSGVLSTSMTDPDTGITMRLLHGFNIAGGFEQMTLECLWGTAVLRPEHSVLITTTAG